MCQLLLMLLLLLLSTHLPSYAPCWQPWFPYTGVHFLVGVRDVPSAVPPGGPPVGL